MNGDRHYLWSLLAILALVTVWSAIAPHDYLTWGLEVFPVLVALPCLVLTRRQFPFSRLAYGLMLAHAVILLVGGHYTYAEMPLFSWLRDTYDLSRNYYDRVGHLAQGFVPAIVAREILLRNSPLQRGKWLFFLVSCVCLAISACYEFIEWWVALASGDDAVAFLATQGDVWDTQWDMLLALLGAVAAQLWLSRAHDRSMARLELPRPPGVRGGG
ncbi:inner membrane protein YjdF [mine drainage metagenome]|uniref:Inner membrane protein YjdF n=1 Tax=mine drainage metagenome TaxID=410659 RepID=A0A1J5QLE4_9ZZZZ